MALRLRVWKCVTQAAVAVNTCRRSATQVVAAVGAVVAVCPAHARHPIIAITAAAAVAAGCCLGHHPLWMPLFLTAAFNASGPMQPSVSAVLLCVRAALLWAACSALCGTTSSLLTLIRVSTAASASIGGA
eukprot:1159260-Pelagomonas_calceolata.AAC.11